MKPADTRDLVTDALAELTTLYRLYGTDGTLLYVGVTLDVAWRWKSHARRKPWWREVVGATLEHHDSRTAALAAEREAILTEKPVWNVQHCPAESGVLPDRLNYAEIADDLIARIRAGELTPGAWLPTYAEMAAQHGVSISTITRAMALLRDRGLVVGTTGRGVRVAGLS